MNKILCNLKKRKLNVKLGNGEASSVGLKDWSLTKPLDFSIHLASEHQTKHPEITQKRPEWMSKCCRNVSFNKEMTVPSHSISQQRHKYHKPPIEKNRVYQAKNTTKSAHKMPTPCCCFCMLIHIKQPKLLHTSEIHVVFNSKQSNFSLSFPFCFFFFFFSPKKKALIRNIIKLNESTRKNNFYKQNPR